MTNIIHVDFDFHNPPALSSDEVRQFISDLEEKMKDLPQVEVPVKHHFSKGVYAREIFIAKGTLLVGKIHKHENLNIMSQGDAAVLSVDGCKRIQAPFTVVSSPGVKRVIYAHEDTVWTTIHGTDLKDLEKIEDDFIAKNYDEVVRIEAPDVLEIKEG